MAQSASKDNGKSPLGIQPLWEKSSPRASSLMGTLENTTQVGNSRDGIVVDLLFNDPTKLVILSPEPAYEDAVEKPTAQSEQDIRIRNEQTKKA